MFWKPKQNSDESGGGPGDDLKGGFATVAAAMVSIVVSPTLSNTTLPYVIGIAQQSYPAEIVELFKVAWMLLCFPFVFFAARASIAFALTAAGVYVAYRFI